MTRLALPSVAVLAALAVAVPAQPAAGKRYALLVGVNVYDKPGYEPLKYAEKDATVMAEVLTAAGYEVRLMLGSKDGTDRATGANVRAALRDWVSRCTARDVLVCEFFGHGEEVADRPHFCPADAVGGAAATLVPLADVVAAAEAHAGVRVVLWDACRSDPDPARGRNVFRNTATLRENTALFLACRSRQKSFESEKAGGGHGVFAHCLLEGLRGKLADARNDRGEVTVGRLSTAVDEALKAGLPDRTTGGSQQQWQFASNLPPGTVLVPNRRTPAAERRAPADQPLRPPPPVPTPPDGPLQKLVVALSSLDGLVCREDNGEVLRPGFRRNTMTPGTARAIRTRLPTLAREHGLTGAFTLQRETGVYRHGPAGDYTYEKVTKALSVSSAGELSPADDAALQDVLGGFAIVTHADGNSQLVPLSESVVMTGLGRPMRASREIFVVGSFEYFSQIGRRITGPYTQQDSMSAATQVQFCKALYRQAVHRGLVEQGRPLSVRTGDIRFQLDGAGDPGGDASAVEKLDTVIMVRENGDGLVTAISGPFVIE